MQYFAKSTPDENGYHQPLHVMLRFHARAMRLNAEARRRLKQDLGKESLPHTFGSAGELQHKSESARDNQ